MKNVYSLIEMTLIIIITIIMPIFVNFTSNVTALHHILSFIEIIFSGTISSKDSFPRYRKEKILEVAIWMLVHNLLACWISLKNVGVE